MINKMIDNVNVTIEGIEDITDEEIQQYIDYTNKEYFKEDKHHTLSDLYITFNGEDVKIDYKATLPKFERIRRITGYLVGTLDRWNDSKQKEEKDRVKHDTETNKIVYGLDEYSRVIPITRNCLNQEIEYKIA